MVDAAYWMKGCSSLGRLRYAVLLGVGKKKERQFCLVDIKEAVKAAAPRRKNAEMPKDLCQAGCDRGVSRCRRFLGERMLAAKFLSTAGGAARVDAAGSEAGDGSADS